MVNIKHRIKVIVKEETDMINMVAHIKQMYLDKCDDITTDQLLKREQHLRNELKFEHYFKYVLGAFFLGYIFAFVPGRFDSIFQDELMRIIAFVSTLTLFAFMFWMLFLYEHSKLSVWGLNYSTVKKHVMKKELSIIREIYELKVEKCTNAFQIVNLEIENREVSNKNTETVGEMVDPLAL